MRKILFSLHVGHELQLRNSPTFFAYLRVSFEYYRAIKARDIINCGACRNAKGFYYDIILCKISTPNIFSYLRLHKYFFPPKKVTSTSVDDHKVI